MHRTIRNALFVILLTGAAGGAPAQTTASKDGPVPPVREFVTGGFEHGVPLQEALRYRDPKSLQDLTSILKDPAMQEYWPNAAVTLAMAGGSKGIAPLLEFVYRGEGRITAEDFQAKTSALGALGFALAIDRGPAKTATEATLLKILVATVRKQAWQGGPIRWLPPEGTASDRDAQLVDWALRALGVSGEPQGEIALRQILSRPNATGASRDSAQFALETNRTVRKAGLASILSK